MQERWNLIVKLAHEAAIKITKRWKTVLITHPETNKPVLLSNESEQNKVTTEHFKKLFYTYTQPLTEIEPQEMAKCFSTYEINKSGFFLN